MTIDQYSIELYSEGSDIIPSKDVGGKFGPFLTLF